MPTPVTPDLESLLGKLEQRGGTPVSPEMEPKFAELEARAQRAQPPAPAPPPALPPAAPPPQSRPGGPALGPHGRVVDPATGQEFGLPGQGAHEAAPQSFAQSAIELGNAPIMALNTGKDAVFRVLAWAANPVTAFLNSEAKAGLSGEKDPALGPWLGSAKGFLLGAPHSLAEAGRAAISPEIQQPEFFSQSGMSDRNRAGLQIPMSPTAERYVRKGLDIAGGFVADAGATHLLGPLAHGAAGLLGRAAGKAGALDTVIPGIGKSLNTLQAESALTRDAQRLMAAAAGKAGQIKAEGDQAIRASQRIMAGLTKQGIDLAGTSPDGARRVNLVDELVYHWISAGTQGARYANRGEVGKAIAGLAQTPAEAAALQTAIPQMAAAYTAAWRKVGLMLEDVGYLKKGTVAKWGDKYAAVMYHSSSHNVDDIENWLHFAHDHGAMSPAAVALGEQLAGRVAGGGRGAGMAPAQARKPLAYAERVARGQEFQAALVFARSLSRETKIAGKLRGLQDIAANPEMASATRQPGWVLTGRELGFAEPTYLHPAVHAFLKNSLAPDAAASPALRALEKVSNFVKAQITTLNAPMILHKIKFDHVLAEGQAAAEGLGFTAADVARAVAARKLFMNKGTRTAAIDALRNETNAFTPRGSSLGELGQSLQGSIGIETAGQKLLAGQKKIAGLTREGIGAVEQTYKIALAEKLAPKLGYRKAAQIAQETISGEHLTNVTANAFIKAVEKYGGIPFVTARSKALPKMLAMVVHNPDILLRYSGYRVAHGLAEAGGPAVQQRQQLLPNADTAIPVPGATDRLGKPKFAASNPFAINPLDDLGHLGYGIGGPLTTGISAAMNLDLPRAFGGGGLYPITKPGEMPPLEEAAKRLEFVRQRTFPPLLGRGISRIGHALAGTTEYGGPFQEPESLTEALLGVATGLRLKAPETDRERGHRASQNVLSHQDDRQFINEYRQALRNGSAKPTISPLIAHAQTPRIAAEWYKNAYRRLADLANGNEYKGDDKKARMRLQMDWMDLLEKQYKKLSGEQLTIQTVLDQLGEGVAAGP